MSTTNPRYTVISTIEARQPTKVDLLKNERGGTLKISEYFGSNTFGINELKKTLSGSVFNKLMTTIEAGKKLDKETANAIAAAILEWANEKGVTHFCHWFQPQTGMTAEKHDSFMSFDDSNTKAIEKFSGSMLIQSEPDASSFPSGGMRTTFEARGYTAWDPTSPTFIVESTNGKTLCIPSLFISYHGDALDEKTPLLRSMEYLGKKALDVLHTLGHKGAKRVIATIGAEQEYFLIDRLFYNMRPDLVMTGRTLLGGQPPRGQQLEDHYFGSIPERVLAYMQEVEQELYRLGVPVKTRHNEVAPSQFETAPIFEEANVASDHNQVTMEVMRRVALKHHYAMLLHEKPFAGVNGSGKHCNWSMAVEGDGIEDNNLLNPGNNPSENIRFLVFLAATLKGVYRHSGLMRAAIAVPGNDHRLGANEAPPAIISAFLGQQLNDICNKIESGVNLQSSAENAMITLGVSKIPSISKDNTDRNRTSPFAFTGNKFEFRAVGASMPISFPVTVVNSAVAEALGEINETLKKKIKSGKPVDEAALEVVREALIESKNVRFEGNNYSDAWVKEAEKRGLPNLRRAPDAIEQLNTSSTKELFTKASIMTEAEIHARYHIMIERYVKKLLIEADTLASMVDTHVVPAATKEQQALANMIKAVQEVDKNAAVGEQLTRLNTLSKAVNELLKKKKSLTDLLVKISKTESESDKAHLLGAEATDMFVAIRAITDSIEDMVSDEYWILPKYREMLFIS